MPQGNLQMGKTIGYAVLIWVTGFVWGSCVFRIPALKNLPSIPYVSRYPAISFPLLIVFAICAYFFAKSCLATVADKSTVASRIGAVFSGTNFVLDLLVLALLFKNGVTYFESLTVWLAYAILFFVPQRVNA